MKSNEQGVNRDFTTVTELPGDEVTSEQIERLAHRYLWAGEYCRGRDALELACGAGQGLGYLASVARTLLAGDISPPLLARAHGHYGDRIPFVEVDAQSLPFADRSLDVVLLFEALYYLPSPDRFMGECRRVLRPGGHVLIVTANKDLFDFNPSPYSQAYLGVVELGLLARQHGFSCDFYGVTPVDTVSLRQRALRPIKLAAVKLDLMPRTMAGKKWLKRVVFGRLSPMPAEVDPVSMQYTGPAPLAPGRPDRRYKVIYAAATLRG